MPRINHKRLWENLLSEILRELVKIDKLPTPTVEDLWIKVSLINVIKKMCALDRLPPRLQKPVELTRKLFEDE
jgi:hypothetical protein